MLVAAACGAESVPSDVQPGPEYASVRFEIVAESPEPEGEPPFRSSGAMDLTRGRSEIRDESGFHEITVGQVSYEELQSHVEAPSGARWCRYDGATGESHFLETLDQPGINLIGFYAGSQPESPAAYLDYLREVSRVEPSRVGVETVRGVPAVRYSTLVDNRLFWSRVLAAAGWRASSIERYLGFVAEGEQRVEAWIDASGYARRVVRNEERWTALHPESPDAEPPNVEPTVVTTEYFDFHADVEIQPPIDAEVVDCAELSA